MEYKICENCNEKLHVRTQKCPFCNTELTEKSQIITEVEEIEEVKQEDVNQLSEDVAKENIIDEKILEDNVNVSNSDLVNKDAKDYVYKAEVRHSLEYTKLMSNSIKVFITAISMIPVIGQLVGTFFGIFFFSSEDNDRKSFGRALIGLSVIMFFIYGYNLVIFSQIIESEGLVSVMEGMQK